MSYLKYATDFRTALENRLSRRDHAADSSMTYEIDREKCSPEDNLYMEATINELVDQGLLQITSKRAVVGPGTIWKVKPTGKLWRSAQTFVR